MAVMEKGNLHSQFTDTLLDLTNLAILVEDNFFAAKIRRQENNLITSYTELILARQGTDVSVAQYKQQEFISCLDQTVQIFEDLQYLNLAPASPLLKAQRILLSMKLAIVENQRTQEQARQDKKEDSRQTIPASRRRRSVHAGGRPNENREKILRFIQLSDRSRTKDIVEEFSSLSERTVKRSLKELVSAGLLKKHAESKAVYYSANSQ